MLSRRTHLIAALFVIVHAVLLAWSAVRHSPSIDEVGHMAAGLSHWKFGRFDLYRVNPPLVRLVATAPVTLMRPVENWSRYSFFLPTDRPEFDCGEQFITLNGLHSLWFFTVARWACIPFSILGALVCYRWAGELYGPAGGLLSLTLWCFCPNILGHAQMITPDVGATALGAATCYAFWRWLRHPTWGRAIIVGVALGLAEVSKTTFLLLYAVLPLAWLAWQICPGVARASTTDGPEAPIAAGHGCLVSSAQFILMLALSVWLINVAYGFEKSFRPLGTFEFFSKSLAGREVLDGGRLAPGNRFAETWMASIPVPLPANYVLGVDRQRVDFESGFPSYLRGEWRSRGWWYYYLYGLGIKVPLGTLALFLLAALVRPGRPVENIANGEGEPHPRGSFAAISQHFPQYKVTWRDESLLWLPAVAIFAFVSSQTGFNHHLRYVLPVFPFLFIWIGRLGRLLAAKVCSAATDRRSRAAAAAMVAALLWSIGSSLWYYPHNLSYFNEVVGGPTGGRWHMLDSNLDWGQDLFGLKRWLDKHPEVTPLGLAYYGCFDPRAVGINFSLPPLGPTGEAEDLMRAQETHLGPQPGWYAVSAMLLHGCFYHIPDGEGGKFGTVRPYFTYFQRFTPVAQVGYSIYIYHLEPAEVDRVRRKLGMAALGTEAVGKD